jgi:hypothetical protein
VVERERSERAADVIDKWWYRDRDGEGVLLRYRLEADDCDVILQTVADGEYWVTGWPAKMKVPLYRAFDGPGQLPVFVVQGEYAVEAAIAMGLSAVTSAGGADDVERSDWRPLAGREVVFAPTNSDEGRRFARAAARMALALDPPPVARMLALPGLEEGGDIADFGWDLKLSPEELAGRLRALAARAPVMKPADIDGRPLLRRLSSVVPAPVRWLWPGRVPIGKPTVIFGGCDPGKSMVALNLAARVSTGADWPDERGRAPLGTVILLCRDDDLGDTIRPRLDHAGADPRQIIVLDRVTRVIGGKELRRDITLDDMADLERAIEIAGDVRLVVIDPLSAYFGPDMPIRRRIRPAIAGLARLAYRHSLAVLITAEIGGRDGLGYTANAALMSVVRLAWLLTPVPGPAAATIPSPGDATVLSSGRVSVPSLIEAPVPNPVQVPVTRALQVETPSPVEVPVPNSCEAAITSPIDAPWHQHMEFVPLKSGVGRVGGALGCRISENGVAWEAGPVAETGGLPHALGLPAVGLPGAGPSSLLNGPALSVSNGPALSVSNGPALSLPNGPAASLSNGPAVSVRKRRSGPRPLVRDTAGQWLLRQLADGPVRVGSERCEAGTLRAAARSAGMKWMTVRRAFHELRGIKERCPATGTFIWRLPGPTVGGKARHGEMV